MQDVLVFLGALTLMALIGLGVGVPMSILTMWAMNQWEQQKRPTEYTVPTYLGTKPNWPTLDARGELHEAKLRDRKD